LLFALQFLYHFYNRIKESIPNVKQSNLDSIHYASPGYMKISSEKSITNIALKAIQDYSQNKEKVNSNYRELSDRIQELDLNKMSPANAISAFSADSLCLTFYVQLKDDLIYIDPQWLKSIVVSDFEICKMLMGHFRRLRTFHSYLSDKSVRVVTNIIK
jgi:hypothetical protein